MKRNQRVWTDAVASLILAGIVGGVVALAGGPFWAVVGFGLVIYLLS